MIKEIPIISTIFVVVIAVGVTARADTSITYQGELKQNGGLVNGSYNMNFSLWDAMTAGNQIFTIAMNGVQVVEGRFTVELDFGPNAFDNSNRWLEIKVRGVALSPRSPITRSPYAVQTRGIYVDENEKVGIGTTDPNAIVQVAGDGSGTVMRVTNGGGGNQNNTGLIVGDVVGGGRAAAFYGVSSRDLISVVNDGSGKAAAFGGDVTFLGGNVGIGTTAPEHRLHVESNSGEAILGEQVSASGSSIGVLGRSLSTQGIGVYGRATTSSGANRGVVGSTFSTSGRGVYGEAIAMNGLTYGVLGVCNSPSGYGVFSQGDFGGIGAKYFIQPHPSDPSKEIRFVCLEGNESGTYFRGTAQLENGRAYIEVPEEFRLVSEPEALTVQITPRGRNAGLWVESSDVELIVVRGDGDVEFDYFVNGIRRGYADHVSIQENHAYIPETRSVPYGSQYREGHRRILVDNGILNSDFTPNEQTAAALGWTLREPAADKPSKASENARSQK